MGAFNGPTEKLSHLYSDAPYVSWLRRSCSAADQKRFATTEKKLAFKDPVTGAVAGGSGLKESQAYPEEYGQQVAKVWSEHWDLVEVESDADEESSDEETFTEKDSWSDAKLADVCDWLGLPVNQLACRVAFAE